MKEFIAEKPQTLKEFTDNTYAQGSFFWNYLIRNREIKINGKKTGENVFLAAGDKVAYYLPSEKEKKSAFYPVYEDENVLVIDKESGVNSEAVFAALSRERKCFFIHRLDRNTAGLLIFALREETADCLEKAFRERRVEKIYHALCCGRFEKDGERLTAYLKKDEEKARVHIFGGPVAGAEKIVTEYEVLKREKEYTKVKIVLHTGRTHQIRAHLAYIGCPVAGDTKYGFSEENKRYGLTRQCLVAKSLSLNTGGPLDYLKDKMFVSRFEAELRSNGEKSRECPC